MAKRSTGQFARKKNDLYRTWDRRAVKALLPHLPPETRFIEPCAGRGDMIAQLVEAGHHCVGAFDIEAPKEKPQDSPLSIVKGDARTFLIEKHYCDADMFITNPPWTRELLHAIIFNLYWQRPLWALFDADWAHTQQARPYLPLCRQIVSVGRLRWEEGSKHDGKDNVAWYRFERGAPTQFIGRA